MKLNVLLLLTVFFLITLATAGPYSYNTNIDTSSDLAVSFYTGNLTNLSEMADVDVTGVAHGEVLNWDSTISKWIAIPSGSEIDPIWTSQRDNYYLNSNPYGYYNITTLPDLNSSGLIIDWNASGYITNQSQDLSGYYLVSNPFGFYNITSAPIYINDTFSGNYTSYLTLFNWNKTYADTIYAGIEWDYNQTTAAVNLLNGTGLVINWSGVGDTDTTYTAGSNLTLTGTVFSLNATGIIEWLDSVYAGIGTIFDGTWASLTGKPTLLSNFTDDLGNRGYTHLTNFSNDLGIGNWTLDKPSYSTKVEANLLYATINEPLWTANQSNYVPYTGASSNLVLGNNNFSVNNSTLFVNSNNGNVGIGTTSPQNKLNVVGTGNITGVMTFGAGATFAGAVSGITTLDTTGKIETTSTAVDSIKTAGGVKSAGGTFSGALLAMTSGSSATAPAISFNGDNNNGLYRYGADSCAWSAGGAIAQSWTPTIVTSYKRFEVEDTTEATTTLDGSLQTDGGLSVAKKGYFGDTISANPGKTNANAITFYASNYGLGIDSSDLVAWVPAAQGMTWKADTVTGTSLMTLEGGGNLGIGTTTPTMKLDVNGSTNVAEALFVVGSAYFGSTTGFTTIVDNEIYFRRDYNGDAGGWINLNGYAGSTTQFRDLQIGNGKGAQIAIFDGSTNNVGIGTTSPTLGILQVNGSIDGISIYAENNISAEDYLYHSPFTKSTKEEALNDILKIKGDNGKINHSTLPLDAVSILEKPIYETTTSTKEFIEEKDIEENYTYIEKQCNYEKELLTSKYNYVCQDIEKTATRIKQNCYNETKYKYEKATEIKEVCEEYNETNTTEALNKETNETEYIENIITKTTCSNQEIELDYFIKIPYEETICNNIKQNITKTEEVSTQTQISTVEEPQTSVGILLSKLILSIQKIFEWNTEQEDRINDLEIEIITLKGENQVIKLAFCKEFPENSLCNGK